MADKQQDNKSSKDQKLQPDTTVNDGPVEANVSGEPSDKNTAENQSVANDLLSSEIHKIIESASKPRRQLSRFQIMVLLSAIVLCIIVTGVVFFRPSSSKAESVIVQPSVQIQSENIQSSTTDKNITPVQQTDTTFTLTKKQADSLDQAVSFRVAKELYNQGQYKKACYVFKKLQENLLGDSLRQQCLKDWLSLQMARCLQQSSEKGMMDELFTEALNSKSLVVQAMANYHIAVAQGKNQQHYEAYNRIYRTLSLLKAFQKWMPPAMEADCYYMAAESLTRHILGISNDRWDLPGSEWMNRMESYELPVQSQQQLSDLLLAGIEQINDAVLMPKVEYDSNRKVGVQWTVACLNAPFEQVIWQFASESDLSVNWEGSKDGFNDRRVTMLLPFVDRHYLAEVVTSCAGLIWHYDGYSGTIYDPVNYNDIDRLRQVFVQKAISMWQRFQIRYRNNSRIPNAQFCLGRLYTISDDKPMALGVYKLVSTQYDQPVLAAYGLFNMAMLKVDMRDYAGAREDLNELLIRYPDCLVVNKALMYLGDVLLKSRLYAESAQIYDRLFHLDVNAQTRRSALFGLGQCCYEMADYESAAKWLSKALEMAQDQSDDRVGVATYMLGRSYISLGQYRQACDALRMALGQTLDNHEYIQTVLELAQVECEQGNYLRALNELEAVSEERLNQEDSCKVMIAKANVYRSLGLLDAAISLLRRQIEFIAESSLRAQLSLELAHCYMLNEDLRIAEKELNDVMYDLPVGYDSQRGGFLLARIAFIQQRYGKAESFCLDALETNVEDDQLRSRIHHLLGDIYKKQNDFDRAALAFAGLISQDKVQ